MTTQPFQQLAFAAAAQGGLVSGAQAARLGVDRPELDRLAAAGLLFELGWDVHQLTSSPLAPRYAYPYAAWLALAPDRFAAERPTAKHEDAVLSRGSAARLLGIGAATAPTTTFVTMPTSFLADGPARPRAVELHPAALSPADVTVRGGVAVTTPHRTILDLVRSHTDHGEVRGVITDAVRLDFVDLGVLYEELSALAEHHEFPADGPEFAGYFLPDLVASDLSPRNLRALTVVVRAGRVDEQARQLGRVLAAAPGGTRADDTTVRALAAEIVGRTEQV